MAATLTCTQGITVTLRRVGHSHQSHFLCFHSNGLILFRVFGAIGASLSLSLAVLGIAWGWADLAANSTRVAMDGWATSKGPMLLSWPEAYQRLNRARTVNPLRADYSADLGRLLAWQAWFKPTDVRHGLAYRTRAVGYYAEALRKRPSWGYGWASLAEMKALAGHLEADTYRDLEVAIELWPFERRVQTKIIWLGFATWDHLTTGQRIKVTQTLHKLARNDPSIGDIIRIAVQYGRQNELQSSLAFPQQMDELQRVLGTVTQ